MKKELVFLQVSAATYKEAFLQHIHNLIQIPLLKGDSYNSLFTRLRDWFKDSPELPFIEDWIEFNLDSYEDKSVFDTILTNEDKMYAVFDLVPIKE